MLAAGFAVNHPVDSLDLNLLRVYEALISEGNVTRAAIKLNRTQPAISNSLARLREMLGDPLFEKTATGIRPTVRGRELWERLEPHYRGLAQALSPTSFDATHYDGRILIAMSDYTVAFVMPRLSHELQTLAPGLTIEVVPYSDFDLAAQFERGGMDMAVGMHSDDEAMTLTGLKMRALWPVRHRCLMRRQHPLARGKLTLERYLQARHLEVMLPGMPNVLRAGRLAELGAGRRIMLTINGFAPVLPILAGSDLVAVVPAPVLDLGDYAPRLCERDLPIALPERQLRVIWHARSEGHRAHQWLKDLIVESFSGMNAPA
ncbi:LysR family transcriptional regulator [Variovorax sp. GT1P44]|uniref:LysR family transcriptional regulator n=1 Tax=Variovorax sp. GT1P44 TaxID=3443742 RepID=UPI003F467B54